MKTGIKTSDEIQSLLTARGHFSRTLSWFGRYPGIDKHFTRIQLHSSKRRRIPRENILVCQDQPSSFRGSV